MKNSIILASALSLAASFAAAEGMVHKIAVHVNENDPKVMNIALNNVQNVSNYYEAQGDSVEIEVVTYGPGLNMLIEGTSPVADRIATMSLALDNLSFRACGNTHRAMSAKKGEDIALLEEASMVPSGVVRLIELQEDGFAYVKP